MVPPSGRTVLPAPSLQCHLDRHHLRHLFMLGPFNIIYKDGYYKRFRAIPFDGDKFVCIVLSDEWNSQYFLSYG